MPSLLALGLVFGCGGADFGAIAAPLATRMTTSGESEPAALLGAPEETAFEKCTAPVDPSAFADLGGGAKRNRIDARPKPQPVPADPCEQDPTSAECAHREALKHFQQRRFDRAAKGFRKLALGNASEYALDAARLYLESLNMLGTRAEPARPVCFEVLESDIGELLENLCHPLKPENEEACSMFVRVTRDIRRLEAENDIRKAEEGGPDAPLPLLERAGDIYRGIFDEACPPKGSMANADGARCDELLFNAHRAYRAAGAREKAEGAYRAFFDPRFGLLESPLAAKMSAPAE